MAQAVLKDGELLLPHDAGCGASVITPDNPDYEALLADAVRDDGLGGTAQQDAEIAARWRHKWALQDRRTA